MMNPAVRVENALPPVLKKAAVAAFAVAASIAGATVPSRPWPAAPTLRMVVVAGAPVIAKRPIMFPSRSVMTIVTAFPRDVAAEAACCKIVCTSVDVRLVVAANDGGTGSNEPGVGCERGSSGGPPPTSPMPTRTRLLDRSRYLIRINTSPDEGRSCGTRTITDETHGFSGTAPTYSTDK